MAARRRVSHRRGPHWNEGLVASDPEGLDPYLTPSPAPACHPRPHRRCEEPEMTPRTQIRSHLRSMRWMTGEPRCCHIVKLMRRDTGSTGISRSEMPVPSWFYGGDPTKLFVRARLHSRPDRFRHVSSVQTEESYYRRAADLVTVVNLAGPEQPTSFDLLDALTELIPHDASPQVLEAVNQKRVRVAQTRAPVDALVLHQLELMTAPSSSLGETTRRLFEDLREIGMQDDSSDKLFARAGVQLIQRSEALLWRSKLASLFVQMQQDPRLQSGDVSHLKGQLGDGGLAFQSSSGLNDGLYLLDAYLGPLLGALTPAVWAFTASRSSGSIVTTLGQPLAGASGEATELLQLVSVPGATRSLPTPELSPGASTDAVTWWGRQLNELFSVLSDPVVFTNRSGIYQPAAQLQAVLSIEQLFRRTTSIQVAHRDTNARRVLMFTVLDTLERLTNRNLDAHSSLSTAIKTLEVVRETIPVSAAEVLLPAAERAVASLRDLQDGFFLPRRPGAPDTIDLRLESQPDISISVERATGWYIKALRDATHGHGSNKVKVAERTNALLAQHNGAVPHDLGLLGYLYLLDLLCNPERLRCTLERNARSGEVAARASTPN